MRTDSVALSGMAASARLSPPAAICLPGRAAALFMVVWPDYLPMVNAPNHLARLYLLAAPDDSALRRMYSLSWALMPDLGLDLVFVALRGFVPPRVVIELCVLSAIISILLSAYVIQRAAFGRLTWSVAFVPIFVFGSVWHMGYVNFLMGVGCAMAGLAVFVSAQRRLSLPLGILLGAVGVATLICHAAGFATFAVLLSALYSAEELSTPGRATALAIFRKCMHLLLVLLPGLLLYAMCEKPVHAEGLRYTASGKLFLPMFSTFGTGTDADVGVFAAAIVVFALLCARGGLRVWPPGRLP